jgi:hypothetical protein
MKRRARVSVAVVAVTLGLLASVPSVVDAGTIAQVVVPSATYVDTPVDVVLVGTGTCNGLSFTDGENPPGPINVVFPRATGSVTRKVVYHDVGFKVIVARGTTPGCVGVAVGSTTVFPKGPSQGPTPPALCAIFPESCPPTPPAPPPVIASVQPQVIGPAGFITLQGSNFDPEHTGQGELLLLMSDGPRSLDLATYFDTTVSATIPFNISGVLDQTARLQIKRGDGVLSNVVEVSFVAARDSMVVPSWAVRANCSFGATWNKCNDNGELGYCVLELPPTGIVNLTINGFHNEDCLATGNSGSDSYAIPLNPNNGWRLESVDPPETYVEGGSVGLPTVIEVHDQNGTEVEIAFVVQWQLDFNGGPLYYDFNVHISGPRGVSPF